VTCQVSWCVYTGALGSDGQVEAVEATAGGSRGKRERRRELHYSTVGTPDYIAPEVTVSHVTSLLTISRLTSSDPCTSLSLTHFSLAKCCWMWGGSLFSGVCARRLVQWRQMALEYPCVGAGQGLAPPYTKLSRQHCVGWRQGGCPATTLSLAREPAETHPTLQEASNISSAPSFDANMHTCCVTM